MATGSTLADGAREQIISVISQAQDAAVNAVATVSRRVGNAVPRLPRLPLVERLPSPGQIVDTTLAFAQDLLDVQKRYAEGLREALEPITSKVKTTNGRTTRAKTTARA